MNTGICKPIATAALCIVLGACDALQTEPQAATPDAPATAAPPLAFSDMVGGKVTLVPPRGYCIDPETVTQRFALIASCLAMGSKDALWASHSLVMTVSISRGGIVPSAASIRDSSDIIDITRSREDLDGTVSFRAKTATAPEGFSDTHWRAATRMGENHIAGIALYAPKGESAHSEEGRAIIQRLIERSREAMNAPPDQKPIQSGNTRPKRGLFGLFGSLSE